MITIEVYAVPKENWDVGRLAGADMENYSIIFALGMAIPRCGLFKRIIEAIRKPPITLGWTLPIDEDRAREIAEKIIKISREYDRRRSEMEGNDGNGKIATD